MEKTLTQKPAFYLKNRTLPGKKRLAIGPLSFKSVDDTKMPFNYPVIKMPDQPQGYIKCKKHDCL